MENLNQVIPFSFMQNLPAEPKLTNYILQGIEVTEQKSDEIYNEHIRPAFEMNPVNMTNENFYES